MEKEKKTRKSKRDRPSTLVRPTISWNIRALCDKKWGHLGAPTNQFHALSKASGIAPSQIKRIVDQEVGPSIDQLEFLALGLGVRPQDLLTPFFVKQQDRPSESSPVDEADRAELQPGKDRSAPGKRKS